jgi:hypothetical protein
LKELVVLKGKINLHRLQTAGPSADKKVDEEQDTTEDTEDKSKTW